jgi:hypothetical protein
MTDTAPRFGVAHPTIVPANHRRRSEAAEPDGESRSDDDA